MSGRAVVPIAHISRRLPEAGRLRFGVKAGKGGRKAIDTWRFTSHDQTALDQVAELYGGEVKPWSDPKAAPNQFEVITNTAELAVVLPPDPLGDSPIYELWGGGGCERRCDGITCTTIQKGPDGAEHAQVDCICAGNGLLACSPKTRLSVMLAGIRFGGVWRLETGSDNAMKEMPGMVELIQSLQTKGLVRATLALKPRRSVVAGETHHFIVPVLGVEESLEQIAAGASRLGALPPADGAGAPAALGAGPDSGLPAPEMEAAPPAAPPAPPVPPDPDDEVVDAELVDDDAPRLGDSTPITPEQAKAVNSLLRFKRGVIGPARFDLLSELVGREVGRMDDLTTAEGGDLIEMLNEEEAVSA